MMAENPFRFSGPIVKDDPISGKVHVERSQIQRQVLNLIQQGEYVQVVGPHQSGRTTLAMDLISRLLLEPETITPTIPVLVSCESLVDACRECFIDVAVGRLRRVMREYLTGDTHARLLDMLAAPAPTTIKGIHELLVTFGDELRHSTSFSEIDIFVDEIETLPDDLAVDVLRLFRALFHHYAERRWEAPYRVIILTTHDLSYLHLGGGSPYNVSNVVPLAPFFPQELDILLDENHAGRALENVTFSDPAKRRIYEETGGHPYLTQRLCHILVERKLNETTQVVLTDKDVIQGVLALFERGDMSVQRLCCQAPPGSDEWKLYHRLATGQREPFEADNPAIAKLAKLGAISDVAHYCQISATIYERQILKQHFWEEFTHITESLPEEERLLLHTSCLQRVLVDHQIRHLVLTKIEDLTQDDAQTQDEIAAKLSDYLDRVLKEHESDLEMEEVHAYIDYYSMEPIEGREKVLSLLVKAFIGRFREIKAAE